MNVYSSAYGEEHQWLELEDRNYLKPRFVLNFLDKKFIAIAHL